MSNNDPLQAHWLVGGGTRGSLRRIGPQPATNARKGPSPIAMGASPLRWRGLGGEQGQGVKTGAAAAATSPVSHRNG